MYESLFHFSQRPFVAAPVGDRYFPAAAIEQALVTLCRGIERAEGPGLLVGPAGTGKSLVCHLLAEHFRQEFRVALLAGGRLGSRRALLQNIMYELGLPFRGLEEGELRLSLIDHLDPSESCPNGMLLLVDEAHTMPLRLLEEIRMITNLVRDGQPRVRLVLAGSLELEERFASPRLQSFQQRIAARCYLRPLSAEETRAYVRWEVSEAGGRPDELFTEAALGAVYDATDGVPRLINQLCDHALIMAAVGNQRQLDRPGIEEAWADLQQLPPPLHGVATAESTVVEFGQLADEDTVHRTSHSKESTGPISTKATSLDPTARLDEIEELLGQSQRMFVTPAGSLDGFADEDFQPFSGVPEVELIFHDAHNPFGQHFEEEEVVIDRYASLESAGRRMVTRVSSDEGREIAAALSTLAPRNIETEPVPERSPVHDLEEFGLECDSVGDPVAPESALRIDTAPRTVSEPAVASVSVASRRAPREANLRVAMVDDRDAIVIDEPTREFEPEPVHPVGKVRRQEYRQLFAKLRRG